MPTPPIHPVKELAIQALVARLETLVLGTAYSFTPAGVVRPSRNWRNVETEDALLVVQVSRDQTTLQEVDGGNAYRDVAQVVDIYCFCMLDDPDAVDDAAADQLMLNREADIVSLLETSPTLGSTDGVLDTSRCLDTEYWQIDQAIDGFTIPFEMHIRTLRTDPRTPGAVYPP